MTEPFRFTVIVCQGPTCGDKRNSQALYQRLEETIATRGLGDQITLWRETCFGHCLRGPNILVCDTDEIGGRLVIPEPGRSSAVLYNRMTVADVDRVIDRHLMGGMIVRPLLNRPPIKDE
ncbi:MAG TPA: (2Fe-2S) ferredoxin domain-containing protein [Polyangia bacterium]|nr:(2Fe-2S) ferredoxin domain-containing protein [Polyangia bacterium]